MTTTAPYSYLQESDRILNYLGPGPAVETGMTPWKLFSPSTGCSCQIPDWVSKASGLTNWLERILCAPDENLCPLTTLEVPNAMAEIRDAFSLNTVQLAQVLRVSRQAIYDWADGKPVKVENRQRIATISDFARKWRNTHPESMGRIVAEEIGDTSLLDHLSADTLDEHAITRNFHVIAERLAIAEANRPPSARELAAKYGMQPVSETDHLRNVLNASLRFGRKG